MTLEEKRSFYDEAIKTLLKLRFEGRIKNPLFIVIEEAENLNRTALEQIIAEGRKTVISVCLITTHPGGLGGNILSQMGNQIIGKTINKEDLEILANIAGTTNTLPNLAVGEWIVNGIGYSRPMKVYVKG